jgi:serine/threonine protein kinase
MIGAVFLHHYKAVSFLGKGSMGSVYLARHDSNQDVAVVKVMNKDCAKDPAFRQFFNGEIETLTALKHPNIVGLRASDFNDPNGPTLVMEFIPGITLEKLLERHGHLLPERIYRLLIPFCRALAYGHARQVIHRDLKPANLMVIDPGTDHESVKVMDFGLAQLRAKPHIPLEKLRGIDMSNLCGTPLYVSPDLLRGDSIDHRADLYSVGVMLYELLIGAPPFNYTDTKTVLNAHLNEKPPRFAQVRPALHVEPEVEAVVRRCLEKFPYERQQNARQLAEEFGRAIGETLTDEQFPPSDCIGSSAAHKPLVKPPPPEIDASDPNTFSKRFDAWMPEPIAIMKLRGFVQDYNGKILESEPGKIRVRFGVAPEKVTESKSLLSWFGPKAGAGPSPSDPIEMFLYMARRGQTNCLELTVVLRPCEGKRLVRPNDWHPRCKTLLNEIKAYFMGN